MYLIARCAFDGNLDNGYTTNGNFRIGQLLPDGSNVEYACNVFYALVGSSIRYCDDGSWDTSRPSCKGELQMRLALPRPRTDYVRKSFSYIAVSWNAVWNTVIARV